MKNFKIIFKDGTWTIIEEYGIISAIHKAVMSEENQSVQSVLKAEEIENANL